MPDDKQDAALNGQAEQAGVAPDRLVGEAEELAKGEGPGESEGVPALGRCEAHGLSPTGGPAVLRRLLLAQHMGGHADSPGEIAPFRPTGQFALVLG